MSRHLLAMRSICVSIEYSEPVVCIVIDVINDINNL